MVLDNRPARRVIRLAREHEAEAVMEEIRRDRLQWIFYSVASPWWTHHLPTEYHTKGGLPCDPRGAMLFETQRGDALKFIQLAIDNPDRYGKHGLRTFMAALHGCVHAVTILQCGSEKCLPTCLDTWNDYNRLIDLKDHGEDWVTRRATL